MATPKEEKDSLVLWKALDAAGYNGENRVINAITLQNLDLVREFYLQVKDTPVPLILFSGSAAEGTNVMKSDLDTMVGLKCGYGTFKRHYMENKHDFQIRILLKEDNIPLGFGKLEILMLNESGENVYGLAKDDLIEVAEIGDDGTPFLSSLKARTTYLENISSKQTLHGPSVTYKQEYIDWDKVPYIKYSKWPTQAMEWMIRRRHFQWPSHLLVARAVDDGCFLVPVGKPGSPTENIEWRISFSLLERDLVWSWNDTEIKCYVVLKIILKDVIDRFAPEVLSSYHLKTLMFWKIERTNRELWHPENLCRVVMGMMKQLRQFVFTGHLPHYFIREYNLFESKVHGENKQKLLHILDVLIDEGTLYCIEQSQYLNEWYSNAEENDAHFVSHWNEINREVTLTNGCSNIAISLRFMVDNLHTFSLMNTIQNHNDFIHRHKMLRKKYPVTCQNVMRIMLLPVYTSLGSLFLAHAVQTEDQQTREALMAKALYNLERGENCDGLSGKLKLAMFYCVIGHYLEAIDIMYDAVDKLGEGSITEYGEYFSSEGLTMNDGMNSMKYFTAEVRFEPCEMTHVPSAIQYEIACENALITEEPWVRCVKFCSMLLCYFMLFMCNRKLENVNEMKIAMGKFNMFLDHMDDFKFMQSAYNLSAHFFLMTGDVKSAIRVLRKSFDIEPSYHMNSALWILGVHLYKLSFYYRHHSRSLMWK